MATGPWHDPKEASPDLWAGDTTVARIGDETRSVVERAVHTGTPYRRRGETTHSGESLADLFETKQYHHGHVRYDATLSVAGGIRVLIKGHLWGDGDHDQRFRIQHRRDPDPTDTIPFAEYDTWVRYQHGRVDAPDDASDSKPTFTPTTAPVDETRTLAWDDLFPLDRRLVAEVELVRNPAFARYRLRERHEWADVEADLKWDLDAFAVGP